jgi:hypothetical protein
MLGEDPHLAGRRPGRNVGGIAGRLRAVELSALAGICKEYVPLDPLQIGFVPEVKTGSGMAGLIVKVTGTSILSQKRPALFTLDLYLAHIR